MGVEYQLARRGRRRGGTGEGRSRTGEGYVVRINMLSVGTEQLVDSPAGGVLVVWGGGACLRVGGVVNE